MDEGITNENRHRRVGLIEGLQSMVGAALALAALAQQFHGWAAAWALVAGALGWAFGYIGLRAARRRFWFGAWDALSFAFVWSYAVVLALAFKMLVIQWS